MSIERPTYGKRAKQTASALVFGKEVTLHTFGRDKYGRTIGEVLLPDGTNVNQPLVKEDWCWWYRKYANEQSPQDRGAYEFSEQEARAKRVGLWSDPDPVPPWEWRRR